MQATVLAELLRLRINLLALPVTRFADHALNLTGPVNHVRLALPDMVRLLLWLGFPATGD
jgi:hypothetical protein